MEIEAKFSIPDEETFQRLLKVTDLAGFGLGTVSVTELHDRYLDTEDGAIQSAGYACRVRCQIESCLVTVKGLGGAVDGIHRRVEHELALPEPLPPQHWPPGLARDLVLDIVDGEALIPLFHIEQTRYRRALYDGDRLVAETNLDRVTVQLDNAMVDAYLEMEAELLPQGRESDLANLVPRLQEAWGLVPDNRSKFERALDSLSQK